MGNKLNRELPEYSPYFPELVHKKPDNFDDKCYICREPGEIEVTRKYDQGHICKACLYELVRVRCGECESNEINYNLYRDMDRLEVICKTNGLVVAGIILEVDTEKDDYKTNKPFDYNEIRDDPVAETYIPTIRSDLWPCDRTDLGYNFKRKYK